MISATHWYISKNTQTMLLKFVCVYRIDIFVVTAWFFCPNKITHNIDKLSNYPNYSQIK